MQIKLEKLFKKYTGSEGKEVTAVNDVSLDIPSNTVYGIIGKSGAGKSSLVRLISLLERPDRGAVYYDDRRVDDLSKAELIRQHRRIGMIFQNFNLFSSRTAAGNIAYPLEICGVSKARIRERVVELLELVGLKDRGDAPVSTLSGGQKQRIAIARALANNPDILFCDEATSALDPQTTRSILELIREIQAKMNLTVVMITHQMEVVRDACQQVAVLDNGRVVEQGYVKDIFTNPQSSVTKDFLSHIAAGVPENDNVVRWSKAGGKYVLHFGGNTPDAPVISNLAKKFDIDVNIRAGGIHALNDGNVGVMIVDLAGDETVLASSIEYLKEQGVVVEEAQK